MKWLAYKLLAWRGWVFDGVVPPLSKMIVLGAPHTSNWDFIVFLAALHHYEIRVRYLGKHTLFRGPFKHFFEATGGIPVDRSRPQGVVTKVAESFEAVDSMILVIAPEGTRDPVRWWKPGFLKIADAADVPIVLAGIDYSRKAVTVGPTLEFEGDISDFMDRAREFYSDKRGLHPELESPIALREELKSS